MTFEIVAVGVVFPLLVAWILWASKTLIAIQRSVIGAEHRVSSAECEIKNIWRVLDEIAPRGVQGAQT